MHVVQLDKRGWSLADLVRSIPSVDELPPAVDGCEEWMRPAIAADALSTTVSVMGDKKGLGLIESIPEVEAILIPQGNKPTFEKTSGAEQYIQEN